jgi:replication-associated recombination protein RarA
MKKKGDKVHCPERLFLVHAVMLLARARKSRAVDNACVVFYAGTRPKREVPDHALDKHIKRGRQLGRGFKYFFDEAAKIENANDQVADLYAEAAVKTLVKNAWVVQDELV